MFASAELLSERVLANRLPEGADLDGLLTALQSDYAARGVNLVKAGKSWAFRTAPELVQQLNIEVDVPRKLSRAAVETLAIVAYHQPVTRAEIEEVRGVSLSRGTLDVLFEAGWIKPRGRRRTPGRPMNWGTTDAFLDHFGIADVSDLPGMEDLKAAGLLNSGPAISAYRGTGNTGVRAGDNGADGDANTDDREEDIAPALPLDAGEDGDGGAEPLDTDSGDGDRV